MQLAQHRRASRCAAGRSVGWSVSRVYCCGRVAPDGEHTDAGYSGYAEYGRSQWDGEGVWGRGRLTKLRSTRNSVRSPFTHALPAWFAQSREILSRSRVVINPSTQMCRGAASVKRSEPNQTIPEYFICKGFIRPIPFIAWFCPFLRSFIP